MAAEEALEQQKMEEEARLQEQINEEVASLAIENEQKASDQQSAADMEKPGQRPLADKLARKPSPFTRRRSRCTKALAWRNLAEGIAQKIAAAQAGMEADEEYAARKESEEKPKRERPQERLSARKRKWRRLSWRRPKKLPKRR